MLKIGLFTFGGGYAMIALLENEFVSKRAWIDKEEFLDMAAIAESTPGPIAINAATYIGYKKAGFLLSLLKKDLLSQNFFDICKQNCSIKLEDISENKKMPRKTDKYWGLMYPEKLINTEN